MEFDPDFQRSCSKSKAQAQQAWGECRAQPCNPSITAMPLNKSTTRKRLLLEPVALGGRWGVPSNLPSVLSKVSSLPISSMYFVHPCWLVTFSRHPPRICSPWTGCRMMISASHFERSRWVWMGEVLMVGTSLPPFFGILVWGIGVDFQQNGNFWVIRTSFFRGKYGWHFGLRWFDAARGIPPRLSAPRSRRSPSWPTRASCHWTHGTHGTGWEPHGPCWQKNLAVASNRTEIIPVSGNIWKWRKTHPKLQIPSFHSQTCRSCRDQQATCAASATSPSRTRPLVTWRPWRPRNPWTLPAAPWTRATSMWTRSGWLGWLGWSGDDDDDDDDDDGGGGGGGGGDFWRVVRGGCCVWNVGTCSQKNIVYFWKIMRRSGHGTMLQLRTRLEMGGRFFWTSWNPNYPLSEA